MAYNKSTFAKFPSKKKVGKKVNLTKKANKKTNDKRKQAIDEFKPHPPAYNGWWYYEMFSRDTFNTRQKMVRR
tara:strand:+ start:6352 stop:6570 length:219 start_codon:yes stop_codon:yes gene_type:complete